MTTPITSLTGGTPSAHTSVVSSSLPQNIRPAVLPGGIREGGCFIRPLPQPLPHPSLGATDLLASVVNSLVSMVGALLSRIGLTEPRNSLFLPTQQTSQREGIGGLIGTGIDYISSAFGSGGAEKGSSGSFWGNMLKKVTSSDFFGSMLKSLF